MLFVCYMKDNHISYLLILEKENSLAIIDANGFRIDGWKHVLEGFYNELEWFVIVREVVQNQDR